MDFRVDVLLFIATMTFWVSCQDCGNSRLFENQGEFSTPNYPSKYNHEANCTWTIVAPQDHFIEVVFQKFDVKNPFWSCEYDNITVTYDEDRSEKFCNDHRPPDTLKSTRNTLVFNFKSDSFFTNGVGFKAVYFIVDKYGNKLAEENDDSWNCSFTTLNTHTMFTTIPPSTATETTTTTTLTVTTVSASTTIETTGAATEVDAGLTTATEADATTAPTLATISATASIESATTMTTSLSLKMTEFSKLPSTHILNLNSTVALETTRTSSGGEGMMTFLVGMMIGAVLIFLGIIVVGAFLWCRYKKNERDGGSNIEVQLETVA